MFCTTVFVLLVFLCLKGLLSRCMVMLTVYIPYINNTSNCENPLCFLFHAQLSSILLLMPLWCHMNTKHF